MFAISRKHGSLMDTILQDQKENVLQNNNTKKLKTPYMCFLFTGDR